MNEPQGKEVFYMHDPAPGDYVEGWYTDRGGKGRLRGPFRTREDACRDLGSRKEDNG